MIKCSIFEPFLKTFDLKNFHKFWVKGEETWKVISQTNVIYLKKRPTKGSHATFQFPKVYWPFQDPPTTPTPLKTTINPEKEEGKDGEKKKKIKVFYNRLQQMPICQAQKIFFIIHCLLLYFVHCQHQPTDTEAWTW